VPWAPHAPPACPPDARAGPPLKPITDIDDPRYVKALAHPLRIRILAMLADRSASPVQLSAQLDATLGTVAYHVRTLHNLGLVELVDTRQRRGATEHYYRAREHPRFPDDAWAGLAPVAKQRMLSAMLQQIGQYVTASAAAGGFDRAEAHMTRRSLQLDDRGFEELASATRRWLDEAEEIGAAAAERLGHSGKNNDDGGGPPVDTGLVVMLFEGRPADSGPGADGDRRLSRRTAAARD
jgi:DNA-binding transcriptional ArsR family regulator